MRKVFVIAPHADDEILGCGATIAQHVAQGDHVEVVVATNAAIGAPELFTSQQITTVRQEALSAHEFLGVSNTHFFDFPAPSLATFPSYKISNALSKLFAENHPDILYLPFPGDLHEDHRVIYRSGLVAARPINDRNVKRILCYETLSETEWAPHVGDRSFTPNVYCDVTKCFEAKLTAMKFFKSQLRVFPHSRSLVALEALAMYRGSTIGVERAEAFMLEREIL